MAGIVVDLLAPACIRVEVAGSVRRQKRECGDIEIVALPDWKPPKLKFGEPPHPSTFHLRLAVLIDAGELRLDTLHPTDGPLHKKLRHPASGMKVDLFLARADNYGNTLVIRTGDEDFSHCLVTPYGRGGLMPDDMRQKDGYLWRSKGVDMPEAPMDDIADRLACPDEETFFRELGFAAVPPPELRDWQFAMGLRKQMERKGAA